MGDHDRTEDTLQIVIDPVPYLLGVSVRPERIHGSGYPFNLPLLRSLDLQFDSPVTFFVGENGTGKSTVIEGVAALCRLPVSGGSRNELSAHHGPDSTSVLAPALRPAFRRRPRDGYFLRAESRPTSHRSSMRDARTRNSWRIRTRRTAVNRCTRVPTEKHFLPSCRIGFEQVCFSSTNRSPRCHHNASWFSSRTCRRWSLRAKRNSSSRHIHRSC